MAQVAINVNAATTTHLVTAPAAPGFIRVLQFLVVSGGTGNVTFQDTSAGALTGPLPLSATCGEVEAENENGIFDLPVGKGLDLVTSAAVQVSGFVKYTVLGN